MTNPSLPQPFSPLKGKPQATRFGTFDTETWGFNADNSQGKSFALGVCYIDGEFIRFTKPEAMRDFMLRDKFRGVTWYAHNLSGFDGPLLFGDPAIFFGSKGILMKGGKWILAKYQKAKSRDEKLEKDRTSTIKFADSLNIIQKSISQIGEDLGFPKGKTPEKFIRGTHEAITDEDFQYCEQDTLILYKALEFVALELGELRPTAPSLAMHYFQRNYLKRTYWTDHNQDMNFKLAYYGGRVEAYRLREIPLGDMYYDINSLYPKAMKEARFPDPEKYKTLVNPTVAEFRHILSEYEGEALLTVHQANSYIGYLPVRDKDNKVTFPVGNLTGHWCFPEIRYALSTGKIEIESVASVTYSPGIESPFAGMVDFAYAIKRDNKGFKKEVFKLLLNSLYGKFGEYHIGNEWYSSTFDRELLAELEKTYGEGKIRWIPLGREGDSGYFSTTDDSQYDRWTSHTIFSWAAYVTSTARVINAEYQDKIRALGIEIYYTDTDSFLCSGELPSEWINKELGFLKYEPDHSIAYINGNKDYRLRETGIRQTKGIPRGKANNSLPIAYSLKTHEITHYSFTRLIRVKESRRRGIPVGSPLQVVKNISEKYLKRTPDTTGNTSPLRL